MNTNDENVNPYQRLCDVLERYVNVKTKNNIGITDSELELIKLVKELYGGRDTKNKILALIKKGISDRLINSYLKGIPNLQDREELKNDALLSLWKKLVNGFTPFYDEDGSAKEAKNLFIPLGKYLLDTLKLKIRDRYSREAKIRKRIDIIFKGDDFSEGVTDSRKRSSNIDDYYQMLLQYLKEDPLEDLRNTFVPNSTGLTQYILADKLILNEPYHGIKTEICESYKIDNSKLTRYLEEWFHPKICMLLLLVPNLLGGSELEKSRKYIEEDPEGKLRNLYRIHAKNKEDEKRYPELNAQFLCQRRLPMFGTPIPYEQIARDPDIAVYKISPESKVIKTFWEGKCWPVVGKEIIKLLEYDL